MPKQRKILPIIYIVWAVLTFLVFLPRLELEDITKIIVIIFLLIQFLLYPLFAFISKLLPPKVFFIGLSTLFAMVVETAFMISKPLDPSLIITAGMPLNEMFKNLFIDLILTAPAYIAIFWVIWHFINKYDYPLWGYIFFISLGQALGDGSAFFLLAPFALIFVPYVMINYHAMNTIPFLLVRKNLSGKKASAPHKYLIPVIAIIITYVVAGFVIKIVGSLVGWI